MREPGELRGAPLHGFQGDRGAVAAEPVRLSVALSREAGARGGTIGRRLARKLGWQIYDQELLEYLAQEGAARQGLFDALPAAALAWIDARTADLLGPAGGNPAVVQLARVILALGVQGEVVLVGRGAGVILPRASTVHVRVVAPLDDRVSYMSQLLRLTQEEAADRVRLRDERRTEFVRTQLQANPADVYQYDLVLNTGLLGEDACADLLVQLVRARRQAGVAPE